MQQIEIKKRSYDVKEWQRGYESQPQEFSYWIDDVEGEIPADLVGTFFKNGPGLLDINGSRIHHPFDGDGMISSVAFCEGRAYFRNRFVQTAGYLEEKKAGKILYRGVFGTQKPGGWLANIFDLKIKNIANTHVIYWGGKLLALWEAAEPHRLDPYSLETLGLDYLDGILQPGEAFSAHPRVDGDRLVNFAVKPGVSSTITIYELDKTGKLLTKHAHSIPGFAFLHDMAITPNYCIFFQNPVSFNPLPFVLGWRGAGQCLELNPKEKTKVILIPRNGGEVQVLETEPCFVFHHANAFEVGDKVFVDSICYSSFPSPDADGDFREVDFDRLPPGELWRLEVDLRAKNVNHEVIESRCCEFPTLHPNNVGKPYRYMYIGTAHQPTGNAPLQAVLKIDFETGKREIWSAAPRGFAGEPVFVPRPNCVSEDDGWLLLLVYDAAFHRSDVVILDARNLNFGPVARLHLKHHIPYGLHGSFSEQYFGPNFVG